MAKIRVAIFGIGNVASALVQGIYAKKLPGLWHAKVGGRTSNDIEVVAAYDIDNRKTGLPLSEALFQEPNVGARFVDVKQTKINVQTGILKDPPPANIAANVVSEQSILGSLKRIKPDIALNLIPSGLPKTSLAYALESLQAGISFVNCTPSLVAQKAEIQRKFRSAKLVIAGDDLMSQFGGTAMECDLLYQLLESILIYLGRTAVPLAIHRV